MKTYESVLTKKQVKIFGPKQIAGWGEGATITATVRYDDECGNGHNTFAITAEIRRPRRSDCEACGMLHEEIARAFPELAPLLKWHLCSSDGPMHYVENTIYHAGDRDCWGLRKGERRQIKSGRTGLLLRTLQALNAPGTSISDTPTGKEYAGRETVPLTYRYGEGKERDLNAARSCAIWPDATDAELCQEPEALRAALLARLPALMKQFRAAVESLGLVY